MKQSDYKRFYFYINEDNLLTVQLSNEPMSECITKTGRALQEWYQHGKNAGHAEQFSKDFEEEFIPKLESDGKEQS